MTAASSEPVLVETDVRHRVALGSDSNRHYFKTVLPGGTIMLEPAVIMTQLERDFLSNPAAVESVRTFEQNATALRRPRRRTES